jgi:hypothetical protein
MLPLYGGHCLPREHMSRDVFIKLASVLIARSSRKTIKLASQIMMDQLKLSRNGSEPKEKLIRGKMANGIVSEVDRRKKDQEKQD